MEIHPNAVWAVVAAALAAVVGAIGVSVKKIIAKRTEIYLRNLDRGDRLVRQRTSRAFVRLAKFYYQMDLIKQMPNVERVLLFFGKDDGGLPNPTKRYTVICRHGWAQDGRRNPEGDYNFELLVDKEYCQMLAEMIRNGRILRTTKEMPVCQLRRYYEAEKVVQSALYYLHIDAEVNELMFISVASFVREFTEEELNYLDIKVDRMRSLLVDAEDGSEPTASLPNH